MTCGAPGTRTVLVVEDDREIRESLRDVLELEGYRVVVAANGREGLDRLDPTDRPCLVLLDLMMPVMGGGEFLAVLRRDAAWSDLPVVVVSAWPQEAKQLDAQTQGFMEKPVSLDELLDVVGAFCAARDRQ